MFNAAPVVSHTDQINSPASGGSSVLLSGVNFGESDLTATAHILVTVCETTSWSSSTGLVCESAGGSGVGTLLSVHVTASSLVGTDTDVLTYDGGRHWLLYKSSWLFAFAQPLL